MSPDHYILIKKLIEDPSFVDWANGSKSESAIQWDRWVQENPDKKELVSKAKLIATGIRFYPKNITASKIDKELEKLNLRIETRQTPPAKLVVSKKILSRWTMAATLAILIIAGIFAGREIYRNGVTVYRTGSGERKEIVLSDGTEVILNANSTLQFVRKHPRNVQMKGEVYFNVRKKPETNEKFTVWTSDLEIEVLGTMFNVNTHTEKTEVMLEEGSVQLHLEERESIMMKPGDMVTYSGKTREFTRQDRIKTEVITSWKDGVLLFDNTPLRQALRQLEETYNIKVKYENNTVAEKILAGGIPSDNLEVSLKTLSSIYNLEIEKIEDTVIIREQN